MASSTKKFSVYSAGLSETSKSTSEASGGMILGRTSEGGPIQIPISDFESSGNHVVFDATFTPSTGVYDWPDASAVASAVTNGKYVAIDLSTEGNIVRYYLYYTDGSAIFLFDSTVSRISLVDGEFTVKSLIDDELNSDSANPVKNRAVKAAIDAIEQVPSTDGVDDGYVLTVENGEAQWKPASSSGGLTMPEGVYMVGEWGHRTSAQKDDPDEKTLYSSGSVTANGKTYASGREWALDWRPYVVTMTCSNDEYTAKAKSPVMELQKNNWLRKTDGTYSTIVAITGNQSLACDKLLYWDSALENPLSSDFYSTYDPDSSTYVFDAAAFWEYCKSHISTINTAYGTSYQWPTDVKLYNSSSTELSYGDYTEAHIVAPWETTDLDLGVYIGRPDDVYLLDGVTGDSGKEWSGILRTAQEFDGIDVSKYKLARTGMSPGPVTAKLRNGAWSTRSFFYNYAAGTAFTTSTDFTTDMSDCCNGAYYYNSTWSAPFRNNGHYPWTTYRSTTDSDSTFEHFGVNQFTAQVCSRNMNVVTTSPYPFAEGGFHSKNTFLNSVEVGFGTKNLGLNTRFSQGSSRMYPCSNEDEFLLNGGVAYYNGSEWSYHTWNETNSISSSYGNWSQYLRRWKPAFQCMEAQIAASLAVEMGVSPGETFAWNGGEWWYAVPTPIDGYDITAPLDGEMNCRIYKLITITNGSSKVKTNLVCGLIEGMNVSGDILVYEGGGLELCVSPIYGNSSNARASFDRIDCFLEVDQTKWHSEDLPASAWVNSWYYKSNGTQFGFESTYEKVAQGYVFAGCARRRLPYSPIAVELVAGYNPSGDDLDKGENIGACCYMNTKYDDYGQTWLTGGVTTGYRHRKAVRFRGLSAGAACSARYLGANNRASYVTWHYGCVAQVLLA